MKKIVPVSLVVAGLLLAFQNCSEVSFVTSSASLMAQQLEFESSASLQIEDNAEFTRQSLVKLKLNSVRGAEMKISNQPDCGDGTWEPYTTAKVWTLSKTNQEAKVYAIFKDITGNISTCVEDAIIHDDQSPKLTFDNPVGLATNVSTMKLTFKTSDNLSGVDKAICRGPDDQAVSCTNAFSVTSSIDGNKYVMVRVIDKAGNESAYFRYDWIFDRTAPTVTIHSRPAMITGSGEAEFVFSGQDALAGIDKFNCRIDGGSFVDCGSPKKFSGLNEGNHKFEVLAVDKAGNSSTTATASWQVDMTAPSLSFTTKPAPLTNLNQATFGFIGSDNGAAVNKFECRLDTGMFSACSSPVNLGNLSQGSHVYQVRGYDSADNLSSPIEHRWVVDTTAPVVTITGGPASLTNQTTASLQWTATDSGSGISLIECSLDGAAFVACSGAGQSFTGLAAGSHNLNVRATDGAGNKGSASRSWTVDNLVPTVMITGGPTGYTSSTSASFTFTGSDSNGIAGFECRLDAGAYSACTSPYSLSALSENGHVFFVRSLDMAGNTSNPESRSWTIDKAPPIIKIVSAPTAIKQGDSAVISYEVIDPSSGVDKVRCGLTAPTASVSDCLSSQSVDLGRSLGLGNYTFEITATDKVGNSQTEKVSFQVTARPVICDPFVVGGEAACNGGLVGDIYYLDGAHQADFKTLNTKTVDYFYNQGILVNAILNLKQLAVSTREFTEGFPSSSGNLIVNNNNQTLIEYFAFRLETVLKLDAASDQPGWYQFATISDDGSMVLSKSPGGSVFDNVLVANDGDHSTLMKCSVNAIWIDDTTRLPLLIKYYQGPRTKIALSLVWKRVDAMNSPADINCGKDGANALSSGGWRTVAPSNLIAPPRP